MKTISLSDCPLIRSLNNFSIIFFIIKENMSEYFNYEEKYIQIMSIENVIEREIEIEKLHAYVTSTGSLTGLYFIYLYYCAIEQYRKAIDILPDGEVADDGQFQRVLMGIEEFTTMDYTLGRLFYEVNRLNMKSRLTINDLRLLFLKPEEEIPFAKWRGLELDILSSKGRRLYSELLNENDDYISFIENKFPGIKHSTLRRISYCTNETVDDAMVFLNSDLSSNRYPTSFYRDIMDTYTKQNKNNVYLTSILVQLIDHIHFKEDNSLFMKTFFVFKINQFKYMMIMLNYFHKDTIKKICYDFPIRDMISVRHELGENDYSILETMYNITILLLLSIPDNMVRPFANQFKIHNNLFKGFFNSLFYSINLSDIETSIKLGYGHLIVFIVRLFEFMARNPRISSWVLDMLTKWFSVPKHIVYSKFIDSISSFIDNIGVINERNIEEGNPPIDIETLKYANFDIGTMDSTEGGIVNISITSLPLLRNFLLGISPTLNDTLSSLNFDNILKFLQYETPEAHRFYMFNGIQRQSFYLLVKGEIEKAIAGRRPLPSGTDIETLKTQMEMYHDTTRILLPDERVMYEFDQLMEDGPLRQVRTGDEIVILPIGGDSRGRGRDVEEILEIEDENPLDEIEIPYIVREMGESYPIDENEEIYVTFDDPTGGYDPHRVVYLGEIGEPSRKSRSKGKDPSRMR